MTKQCSSCGGFCGKVCQREDVDQSTDDPVAWMVYTKDGMSVYVTDNPTDITDGQTALPLFTSPPKRQPLTHEQRLDLLIEFEPSKSNWNAESILIDMVEAKHGIGDKK